VIGIKTSSLTTLLTSLSRLGQFLRAALSHATGPLIALAALLGSARVVPILLSYWISSGSCPPMSALFRLVPSEIVAACMLIAVLVAEQCVRNGVGRLTAYIPAVLGAALVSGVVSMPLILLIHDPFFATASTHRHPDMASIALFVSADAFARGGLVAFIFANRQRWLVSVRQLREAELDRARVERNLAQSHLSAMEAVLQPAELISTLEALESLYERDRRRGDRKLAEFIDRLRSLTASIRV